MSPTAHRDTNPDVSVSDLLTPQLTLAWWTGERMRRLAAAEPVPHVQGALTEADMRRWFDKALTYVCDTYGDRLGLNGETKVAIVRQTTLKIRRSKAQPRTYSGRCTPSPRYHSNTPPGERYPKVVVTMGVRVDPHHAVETLVHEACHLVAPPRSRPTRRNPEGLYQWHSPEFYRILRRAFIDLGLLPANDATDIYTRDGYGRDDRLRASLVKHNAVLS